MSSVRYTSNITTVKTKIQQAKDRALEICGGTAERYAKENLTHNKSVRTGNLRNSITHQQRDDNTEVVGSNVTYAPFVELGHHQEPGRYVKAIGKRLKASFVQGKPYLRPAVEDHRDEYARIIKNELNV